MEKVRDLKFRTEVKLTLSDLTTEHTEYLDMRGEYQSATPFPDDAIWYNFGEYGLDPNPYPSKEWLNTNGGIICGDWDTKRMREWFADFIKDNLCFIVGYKDDSTIEFVKYVTKHTDVMKLISRRDPELGTVYEINEELYENVHLKSIPTYKDNPIRLYTHVYLVGYPKSKCTLPLTGRNAKLWKKNIVDVYLNKVRKWQESLHVEYEWKIGGLFLPNHGKNGLTHKGAIGFGYLIDNLIMEYQQILDYDTERLAGVLDVDPDDLCKRFSQKRSYEIPKDR